MNAYGISTGAKINSRPFDWAWELDECKAVTPGGLVRIDYHGTGQDWLVQEILNRGLNPLLLIQGTMPATQTPAGHAAIVTSAVTRWKGKIGIVEVGGNEPNMNGQTPAQHINLVKAGFQAARAVDPTIDVINGGLAPAVTGTPKDPHTWATQLLPGLKGFITHFNMHLYEDPLKHGDWNNWSRCFDLNAGDLPAKNKQPIRAILDAVGMKNVPICSTESGGSIPRWGEAGVATIVKNAVAELAHRAAAGEMSFLLVYTVRDNEYATGFGLCRVDHSRRPAWTELQKGKYQVKIPIAPTPPPPTPVLPANTSAPSISGSAVEGQTLGASSGAWTGSQPMNFTYQWLRRTSTGDSPIAGAAGPSYSLVAADAGKQIVVAVTATNAGGSAGPVGSAPTALVQALPPVENISQDIHDAWADLMGTTITGKQFSQKPSTRGKWQEAKKLLSAASVAAGGQPLP